MSIAIRILLSEHLCLRDPNQSELGQRILTHSILLIDELGFEAFTFKKLAAAIGSAEASIYRYFENKHKLLVYLVAWYWAWLSFEINYQTHNVTDPRRRLRLALEALSSANINDPRTTHINEKVLHRIVVAESSKAFLTKSVDGEREQGHFQSYVDLVEKIGALIQEVNPSFPQPKTLAVTVLETSRKLLFFAEHLPVVTEIANQGETKKGVADYLEQLILGTLQG